MIKKNSNKTIIFLLIILFLSIALILSLNLISQRQEIRKKAAGTGVVKLTLEPNNVSKNPGDSFESIIYLESTQIVQMLVAGIELNFDSTFLNISQDSLKCGNELSNPAISRVEGNKVSLTCYTLSPITLNPGEKKEMGRFTVNILPTAPSGQTEITFIRTEIPNYNNISEDLSDNGTPAVYIINQNLAPTPTPLPTPNENQIQVQFKIRFYGIYEKKPNQLVTVKIGKGEDTILQEFSRVETISDNEGVYQLVVPLVLPQEITPSNNYFVLIKGPKQLQSRFCLNSGQNRPCRQGKITLSEGINNLDFSNYPLLGGDLPPQDGVVNALDAVNLVDCLNKTDSECLNKADLNLDGIVNSLDVNIMNNTIYTRWEEE